MSGQPARVEALGAGLFLTVRTTGANRREILQALEGFRDRAKADHKCVSCDVLEDLGTAHRFIWAEWWTGPADAAQAVSEPRFRALLGAVKLLGTVEKIDWLTHAEGPEVDDRKVRHGTDPS